MPDQNDLHKFKMALLGYDPNQEALRQLAQQKLEQQAQSQQVQQPQQQEQPLIPQSNDTGMPNLNMDAARSTFFTNLKKLLGQG